jgi:ATP-binding cassette subfamily B protein
LELKTSLQKVVASSTTGSLLIYYSEDISADTVILLVKKSLLPSLENELGTQFEIKKDAQKNTASSSGQLNPFKSFLELTNQYPKLRRKVGLLSLANGLEDATPPLIIGLAIDTLTRGSSSVLAKIGLQTIGTRILVLGGFGISLWLLAALIEYYNDRAKAQLANAIRHDLRLKLYNHLQTLDIADIEARELSEWIAVLEVDTNQVHNFIRHGMTPFFNVTTNVISVATIFLLVSPGFAALQLLMVPPLIYASKALLNPIRRNFMLAYEDNVKMSSIIGDNIVGMSTITSFNSQKIESERVALASNQFTASITKAEELEAVYVPTLRLIAGTGFITSLTWGSLKVGAGTLSAGVLNTMALTQLRLLSAIARVGYGLDMYQKTAVALTHINQTLEIQPKILGGHLKRNPNKIEGEICFSNLTFGYDPDRPIIKNLNLSMPPKKMIGIVGVTGAGKSTLLKLIMRFYDAQVGTITLDGKNIKDYPLQTLRGSMAFVSQNVTLFAGTIFENIAYGRRDASYEEVVNAAKIAEAHDFIMSLPKQYETSFGFGGFSLSGGQRQRLAIARAILLDRPILLLDEATSSLDFETEASLQRSLRFATAGRTTIVIAHRLATIRNADMIYVLSNGSVTETGTHAELLELDKSYAGMWKIQTGEHMDIVI